MRDVNRIEPFMTEIGELWKKRFPNYRFGQLMVGFFYAAGDPFYFEEDEFLEAFKAYCAGEDPKAARKRFLDQK